MFDGNYRSKPRAVNLGTNRNRTNNNGSGGNNSNNRKRNSNASTSVSTSASSAVAAQTPLYRNKMTNSSNSNRDSILNEAHRLRMERYQKLQYNKAAIRIQQYFRGQQLRKQLVQLLYDRIIGENVPCSSMIRTGTGTSSTNKGADDLSMTFETSNHITSDVDGATDTNMEFDDKPLEHCETPLNHTTQPLHHQPQQLEVTTLLNIYLRLQQQPQNRRKESNQQPISELLHQFSIRILEQDLAQKELSDDNISNIDTLLGRIIDTTNKILCDIRNNDVNNDFVLQVLPNTYHILKSTLQMIPTLFIHHQSSSTSSWSVSSLSSEMLSLTDIIIIMSYILQLHQYPATKAKNGRQHKRVPSAMSKESSSAILQLMIGSLTFMIDAGGRQRETEKSDSELLSNADEKSVRNDDEKAFTAMRMFMTSCVATLVVYQPNMDDWCRPILGAVLLIYDSFHINVLRDVESAVLAKFRQCVPDIMKVLRPIPQLPTPFENTSNTTSNNSNGNMKEKKGDSSSPEYFVKQMVSQLMSHYRIPLLLVLSRAMKGVSVETTSFRSNSASSTYGQNRTSEQKEILVLTSCVQFLKYLLLDSISLNDSITNDIPYQQKLNPTWNGHSHFLLWMIQCAVRGDIQHKEEQLSNDNDQPVVVNIIDDGMLENDEETDQHFFGITDALIL
jgi:hypothetical protein